MQDAGGLSTSFGPNQLVFEGSDLVRIHIHGRLEGAHAAALVDTVVAWAQPRPYSLVLVPLDPIDGVDHDARRVFFCTNRAPLPPRAVAVFGGSFAQRVSFEMLARATALLRIDNRHLFHGQDEARARAWLATMRRKLASQPHPRPALDLRL